VQCHLCGSWFAQLGSVHLSRAHGVSAERYRELVGLRPRRPLWAPARRAAQAERYWTRLSNDERLRAGMRKGVAFARSGELQRDALARCNARPVSLERARQLQQSGSALGSLRSERFRARREAQALKLDFSNLAAYYRQRYSDGHLRLDQLAAELRCAQSAIRRDLKSLGLGPDRSRSHGARWSATP
jgi:hypothetical protein